MNLRSTLAARRTRPPRRQPQHLAILRSRRLVSTRKDGNRVFYSLRDPILGRVLADMRRYTASHLAEDLALLRKMRDGKEPRARPAARRRAGRTK